MSELTATRLQHVPTSTMLSLGQAEICHLRDLPCPICVRSGMAWITCDKEDIVLQRGECATILFQKNPVLLSALKGDRLVLELASARKTWLGLVHAVLIGY